MNTLDFLKQICLSIEDEYLRHCLELVNNYVEIHGGANISISIHDSYVEVYDGEILLLKISMAMLNNNKKAI